MAIRAIGGMPGIGKTALAVHAAHELAGRFPDRQLFVNLHGHTPGQDPVTPADALAGLLAATGVDPRALPGDLEGRAALWRHRMARQKALLVLDNAASSAQVAPLLPGGGVPGAGHQPPAPRRPARRRAGAAGDPAARPGGGDVPAPGAPRRRQPAGRGRGTGGLAGYLPLAISLLARVYARHPSWTLADLAAETRASLLTLTAEHDSVAAAFDMSYRHLPPPGSEFFRALGLHPGTTTDAYAAAALAGIPLAEAAAHLDALHGEGLLTETAYRRYGMHDLIRRYARALAAADPAGTPSGRWSGCWTTTSTPRPAPTPAWPARPAPAPRPPPRPGCQPPRTWMTTARRWRGRAPNAPACSPASTTPPPPASTPGDRPDRRARRAPAARWPLG